MYGSRETEENITLSYRIPFCEAQRKEDWIQRGGPFWGPLFVSCYCVQSASSIFGAIKNPGIVTDSGSGEDFSGGCIQIIASAGDTCKQIFQINFAEQYRMNALTPTVNTVPVMTMPNYLLIMHGTWHCPKAFTPHFNVWKSVSETAFMMPPRYNSKQMHGLTCPEYSPRRKSTKYKKQKILL